MTTHDVFHVLPPALHHRVLRQRIHGVLVAGMQNSEQHMVCFVQVNAVVADATGFEQTHQLWPYRIVASLVFFALARMQKHGECGFVGGGHGWCLSMCMGELARQIARQHHGQYQHAAHEHGNHDAFDI